MIRTILALTLVAGAATQQPSAGPAFAAAKITPTTSGARGPGVIRPERGGGLSATNATVRELVAYAWQRHPFDRREVTGGPAWLDTDRYDISATAAAEHVVDADGGFRQTWMMLRSLLADRFKLRLREEKREMPVYALMLDTRDGTPGPKLRKTEIDCGAVMRGEMPKLLPGQGPPCGHKTPPGRLFANTASMATIASLISRHVDRVVIDRTGLTGRFDMELEAAEIKSAADYKPGPSDLGLPPAAGPTIFVAVREQLGLKLQQQTAAIQMIVIESAERPRSQ